MSERTRDRRNEQRTGGAADPRAATTGDGGADDLRERARRLLDLGDDLIRRALSGDSERFLAQNRQQGGE